MRWDSESLMRRTAKMKRAEEVIYAQRSWPECKVVVRRRAYASSQI